jgi:NitT/TauT family transport system substrate-binding protein
MSPSRRDILLATAAAAVAGHTWANVSGGALAEEAAPETTAVRLAKAPSLCAMPGYVVDELLAIEGFTQVDYVVTDSGRLLSEAIASGQIDFALHFSGPLILELDHGKKITMLAGVHVGCFELFAKDGIRGVADLKGRSVGTLGLGSSAHVFLSAMATLVGLDPSKDINWVTSVDAKPIELFLDGKVDAFLGFPPEPQRLRAQGVNHVIVNSAQDRRGRNTSVACWPGTRSSCGQSRSQLGAWFARSCGRPISASAHRPKLHDEPWIAALRRTTITRFRRFPTCRTASGVTMIPKTRFASMRCGSGKPE